MSKYHILKNCDFPTQFADEEEEEIFTNTDNINTMRTSTDNHQLPPDRDLLKHDNYLQQQQQTFQKQYFDNHDHKDDDDDHHNQHTYNNNWNTTTTQSENLFQYNNSSNNMINSKNNETNTTTTTTGKNDFPNCNNLTTPLDSVITDDNTMEIPLLLKGCGNNNNSNKNRRNTKNNKHLYDIKYVCLCQQKGFASNLNGSATRSAKSKILWAIALCCIFMVVEFLGGYIAGSLAIMTDAAHLASDCISFVIGLIAIWLGCKPPDAKMSFGYKRFEVMGAVVSILGIWILTATLVLVAIQRIYSNDYDLDANTMMIISGIGILINIIMIFILHTPMLDLPAGSIGSSHGHSHSHNHNGHHHHGHSHSHSLNNSTSSSLRRCNNDSGHLHAELATRSLLPAGRDVDTDTNVGSVTDAIDTDEGTSIELPSSSSSSSSSSAQMKLNGNLLKHQQDGNEKNLNLRAAMIHVIGDLVQSFGVFFAAILIKIFPKAAFLDPLCTLLFSVIVVMTTTNLFRESMHLIMDSVPQGLSLDNLELDLLNIEGVKSVHHLNVWNHTSNFSILMVHLVIDILTDSNMVLMKATHLAGSAKYNIKHSTIQIERVVTS